jgi:hypothetical protein
VLTKLCTRRTHKERSLNPSTFTQSFQLLLAFIRVSSGLRRCHVVDVARYCAHACSPAHYHAASVGHKHMLSRQHLYIYLKSTYQLVVTGCHCSLRSAQSDQQTGPVGGGLNCAARLLPAPKVACMASTCILVPAADSLMCIQAIVHPRFSGKR